MVLLSSNLELNKIFWIHQSSFWSVFIQFNSFNSWSHPINFAEFMQQIIIIWISPMLYSMSLVATDINHLLMLNCSLRRFTPHVFTVRWPDSDWPEPSAPLWDIQSTDTRSRETKTIVNMPGATNTRGRLHLFLPIIVSIDSKLRKDHRELLHGSLWLMLLWFLCLVPCLPKC